MSKSAQDKKLLKKKYQIGLERTKSYKYTKGAETATHEELKRVSKLKGDKYTEFLESERSSLMDTIKMVFSNRVCLYSFSLKTQLIAERDHILIEKQEKEAEALKSQEQMVFLEEEVNEVRAGLLTKENTCSHCR